MSDREDLILAFDRTRPSHDYYFLCSDHDIAYLDPRGRTAEFIRNQFIWLQDRHDRFHTRKRPQRVLSDLVFRSDHANDHSHLASAHLSAHLPISDPRNNMLDLLLGPIRRGDNDHG